jgi:hypothetical protein
LFLRRSISADEYKLDKFKGDIIVQNEDVSEHYLDQNTDELQKVKGLKLTNLIKEDLNAYKNFILTFKSLKNPDVGETLTIKIKAKSISFLKKDSELENVFTSVTVDELIDKKLLEYEDWHVEKFADTGNLSGPLYNLTLTFEEGYSIDIFSYQ